MPGGEPFSVLRKITPFVSVAILIAALYVGWIFYSRWSSAKDAERASKAKDVERAQDTLDRLGYGQFKILNFYASPGVVEPGGASNICYGVSGAKKVTLDPPVAHVYAAVSTCFQVKLKKSTQYTLTIDDGAGHTKSESFEIRVQR